MPARKLIRPTYRQPNGVIRTDAYRHGDSAIELDDYHRPLEQVHGSGLHGWGVADGLRVTATLNMQDLKIEPGIAIDKDGRHIALAATANAEIGPNADNPGTAPILTAVNADGAVFPTNGLAGDLYVTVQFWETFDATAYANDGLYRFNHTPWIRLRPVGGFVDDGTLIVLARVTLNPAGQVTGLTYGPRRQAVLPTGGVELRYPFVESPALPPPPAQNRAIGNRTAGRIVPREGGGLEVRVPNAADQIEIEADAGTFAKLALAAEQIVARRGDGRESVTIDTQIGNITAGTQGVDGDILVKDSANRLIITLDSHDAALVVGASGKEGDILVKDNAGQDSVRADGNTGTVFLRRTAPASGNAIDVDATFLRVHGWDLMLDGRSGGNKRALVDLGNRLAVNYATDYANGVDIGKLHLADHIRVGFWEEHGEWNPGRYQWNDLPPVNTGLKWSEWNFTTMCEIGMSDYGTVKDFWWQTQNVSHPDANGNIVIQWQIEYGDTGTDWFPWHRAVMWIAIRK
jgi:hypothetical protein